MILFLDNGIVYDVDPVQSLEESTASLSLDDIVFDYHHGNNAVILTGGKTAKRPNSHEEFNDAIVITNRPLKDDELFEVTIDQVVNRWSGSIEAGTFLWNEKC